MPTNIGTNTVRRAKSPLKDSLHRASNAGLRVEAEERSAKSSGNWEVVKESSYIDEQDKDEWILVGKTEGEKKKQEEEWKAKQKVGRRAKQVTQP